jgi:cytochrome d ubiquinol oxidase subunit I
MAIAGFTGSFMVIVVNAWRNHPTGFRLVDGKAVDVGPVKALLENSYVWQELVHMYLAGYIVTGFLLAGAYAIGRLRGRLGRYERTALAISLTTAAFAMLAQVPVGDWAARDVAQPLKLAAMEGLAHTAKGAPEHLLGWFTGGDLKYAIEIPYGLSLLAFHNPNAAVVGIGLLTVADASWAHAIGVVCLLGLIVTGLLAAYPAAAAMGGPRIGRASSVILTDRFV